jgi:chloride channel protein, CIC family
MISVLKVFPKFRLLNARRGPRAAGAETELWRLSLLALGIGVFTGVGSAVFRALIGLVYNLFYLGRWSFSLDANLLDPLSPWGDLVFFAPIIGGLIVVFLVRNFAPEAKGHGVPEVMDSIYYKGGDIRGVVAVVKSIASAISIGTGAAVGREGPIIQIGSALGSTLGRVMRLATSQKITLLSAGAGAGIAATFNTPLGGVLFATEILLPEISNRTFLPVVIATGSATYTGRVLLGAAPAFVMPRFEGAELGGAWPLDLLLIIALGAACGLASWAFIRLLAFFEDWFPTLPGGAYAQVAMGMAAIGAMMVGFTHLFGHPFINGVGYGVIQSILEDRMTLPWLLALLFLAKIFATSVSLGSGASGGIFSPLLFIGATLGGALGFGALAVAPQLDLSPASCAIIGMAAMVGAGTGGVMTAIVMIFEMTRDYAIIVPVIVAVAFGSGIRRALISDTIYTIKLRHRGRQIPQDRHANLYLVQQAKSIMEAEFIVAEPGARLLDVLNAAPIGGKVTPPIVVVNKDHITGIVPVRSEHWPRALRDPMVTVAALAKADYVLARETDLLSRVFERMNRHGGSAVIVVGGKGVPRRGDIRGVITKRSIADAVIRSAE